MALNRENVIRAAEKYVSKGKLEAAIKEYRKVLAENPNDANTLNRVGDLYARIERFDEAVKLFSQIAEQYTRDGFFVKAIAIYKKIIKLDPTSLTVYERLAELYHKQGLLNEARTQYQVLADYYQKHDNAASAITIYQRMAEFEPDNPAFHLKLAELFESQRLIDKALSEYRILADLLIVGGSVDEAAQVYLKALEVAGDDLEFVREAVSGLHDAGHVGEAAKVLARAVELNPEAAGLTHQVGLTPTGEVIEEAIGEPPEDAPSFDIDEGLESEIFAADTFDTGAEFGDDEAFGAAADAFEDVQDALEDTHASATEAAEAVATEEESGVFTFDLDDDEVPASLVTPPPDMLESGVGMGSEDETIVAGGQAAAQEPAAGVVKDPATATSEFAIDWPEAEMEDLELPMPAEQEPASAAPDAAAEVDLDDTAPAQRAEPTDELLELDGFELGEPSLEPVEHSAEPVEAASEDEIELELEAIDLEPLELELETDGSAEAEDPGIDDLGEVPQDEDQAASAAVLDERREEDLLAEARVFGKYGLQEKARDRLSELFQIRPDHLEGLDLQTRIDLESGQHAEVMANANLVARIAKDTGQTELWERLSQALRSVGYTIERDRVVREPGAKPSEDRIAQLLDDLSLGDYDAPVTPGSGQIPVPGKRAERSKPAESGLPESVEASVEPAAPTPSAAPESIVEAPVAEEPDIVGVPAAVEPPLGPETPEAIPAVAAEVPAGGSTPPASGRRIVSLVDELELDDLRDPLADEPQAVPVDGEGVTSAEAAAMIDPLDETGAGWLDELETEGQEATHEEETIFEEEDDFFDLAAELERELSEDDGADGGLMQSQEQSLEDIIEGFKQGVAENLSAEDYDTHFNLGIAYREMGLLDEAIGEFQLAAKDDRYVVDSSSLLGICFLEKGLPELAVRSYRKGLESPSISEEATLGLLYDMGAAYQSLGDSEAAYKTFVEVYGLNSHYRDVTDKLEELKAQS